MAWRAAATILLPMLRLQVLRMLVFCGRGCSIDPVAWLPMLRLPVLRMLVSCGRGCSIDPVGLFVETARCGGTACFGGWWGIPSHLRPGVFGC